MDEIKYYKSIREFSKTKIRPVESLDFTPDGKFIVCSVQYHSIEIWNIASGNLERTIQVNTGAYSNVNTVKISSDGKYIITGSNNGIVKVFDFFSGQLIWKYKTVGTIFRVKLSEDNSYLVTATGELGKIHLFDFSTRELNKKFKSKRANFDIMMTPDNKYIISGGIKSEIEFWDISKGSKEKVFKTKKLGVINSIVMAPKLGFVISGSTKVPIRVWDYQTGEVLKELEGHSKTVYCLVISSDEKHIYSGSLDYTIKKWDLESGLLLETYEGHKGAVFSLSISPDGKTLASGSSDHTIKLWQV